MTLEQLDSTLPQGLHDAQLRAIVRDVETATVTLSAKIVVGLSTEDERKLQYGNAEIKFQDVQYFVSEYPGAESPFRHPGCVWFRFSRTEPGAIPEQIDRMLPPDIQRYSFFCSGLAVQLPHRSSRDQLLLVLTLVTLSRMVKVFFYLEQAVHPHLSSA